LGESYKFIGRGVTDIIKDALPVSFKLGVYAMLIALFMGIPLGLIAANNHNKTWDRVSMVIAVSGVSVPSFVAAAIFLQVFAFGKPFDLLFPELLENLKQNGALLPSGLWETSKHYILPVVVLGIRPAAVLARLVRAAALEVIQSDFIRTAKSKGLSQQVILYKHVLKNSMIPALFLPGFCQVRSLLKPSSPFRALESTLFSPHLIEIIL
jgi:oligopeptide transport system permease protein